MGSQPDDLGESTVTLATDDGRDEHRFWTRLGAVLLLAALGYLVWRIVAPLWQPLAWALLLGSLLAPLNNPNAIKTIRQNLEHTGVTSQAEVLRLDTFQYLKSQPDRRFDYLYIAPPQYKEMWLQTIKEVDEHIVWRTDDAWVMVQIHPKEYHPINLSHLQEFDQRKYGSTLLVFYQGR